MRGDGFQEVGCIWWDGNALGALIEGLWGGGGFEEVDYRGVKADGFKLIIG